MNYKKYNDYELIYMVRENDENSYNVLFEKYKPVIKRLALEFYRRYSNYGYELDDFIQEGYIGFQKCLKYYDESKNILFYTFLCLCIKRSLISFCNRISGTKYSTNLNDYVELDNNCFFNNKDIVDNIVNEVELEKILRKVLLDLPFEESIVFELKYNNFTHCEISTLLEIPVSTVDYRVRKVRNLLKKKMYSM